MTNATPPPPMPTTPDQPRKRGGAGGVVVALIFIIIAFAGGCGVGRSTAGNGDQSGPSATVTVTATPSSKPSRSVAAGGLRTSVGNGLWKVGKGGDMKAGEYKTTGGDGCYYAILRSANDADVVTNDNLDGPGRVSVHRGQYFKSDDCGTWTLS